MSPGSPRVLVRALCSALAVVLVAPALIVLAGGYLPDAPFISRLGGLINEGLPWIWVAVLPATLLSGLARVLGGRAVATALLAVSLAAVAMGGYVTWRYLTFAADNGANYDLSLGFSSPSSSPGSDQADAFFTYATSDGEAELHANLWLSTATPGGAASPGGRVAVVYVHGGAYVGGGLGDRPGLFQTLASYGYVVFDLEYRLAPPPRWSDAPSDVLCGLAFLRTIAADEGIDPARVVIVGESAGGGLALIAAYAAGTTELPSSCGGDPIIPVGVVAIAPTADLAGIWSDNSIEASDRRFPEAYIGGTPAEFPDRYEAASPFRLIRADVPATLLLTGETDHLVHLPRVIALADALKAAGANYRLLVAPFADHGFDGPAGSFGAQIEGSIVPAFIDEVTRGG